VFWIFPGWRFLRSVYSIETVTDFPRDFLDKGSAIARMSAKEPVNIDSSSEAAEIVAESRPIALDRLFRDYLLDGAFDEMRTRMVAFTFTSRRSGATSNSPPAELLFGQNITR